MVNRQGSSNNNLSHRKSDMGRVTPTTDLNTLRTNNKALNQQLGVGKRDAKTDLVHSSHRAGNPFQDCKRLSQQGLKPQQIAKRMNAKGYPAATIQRAMRQTVPACRNMSKTQFNQHWKHHIQPAMRTPQAVRNQARMQQFKQQNGIPKNVNNVQSLSKAHKLQRQQVKTQAKAQAKQERGVIGQNRKEGVQANAIKNQYRKPTNDNQRRATGRTASKPTPKPDRSAARARIQATRQQQRTQQNQQRTMRR